MSITLTLKNFKKFDNKTFVFNISSVIRLFGKSGTGKTTILKAIAWCLYNKEKNSVIPFSKSKVITSVTLEFTSGILCSSKVIIKRSKPPLQINVIIDSFEYTSSEAEAKIQDFFGEESIWMCSSFLEQKQQNSFLQMSNPEKSNFLSSLVFTNESDFSKILETVSREIHKYDSSVKCNKGILENRMGSIKEKFSSISLQLGDLNYLKDSSSPKNKIHNYAHPNSSIYFLESISKIKLMDSISHYIDKIEKLKIRLTNIIEFNCRYNYQINTLNDLTSKKLNFDKKIFDIDSKINELLKINNKGSIIEIEKYHTRKNEINEKIKEFSKILEIRSKIDKLNWFDECLNISDSYMYDIEVIQEVRQSLSYMKFFDGKNKYNSNDEIIKIIQSKINNYRDIIDSQEIIKLEKNYIDINNKLDELENIQPKIVKEIPKWEHKTFSPPSFKELENEILKDQKSLECVLKELMDLEMFMSKLECPNCSVKLELENGILNMINIEGHSPDRDHQLHNKLTEMKNSLNASIKFKSDEKFNKLKIYNETLSNYAKEESRIKILQNSIINENKEIENFNNKLAKNIQKYEQEFQSLCKYIGNIALKLNYKDNPLEIFNHYNNKNLYQESELKNFRNKISDFTTIINRINKHSNLNFYKKPDFTAEQLKDQIRFQGIINSSEFTKEQILDKDILSKKTSLDLELKILNDKIHKFETLDSKIKELSKDKSIIEAQLSVVSSQIENFQLDETDEELSVDDLKDEIEINNNILKDLKLLENIVVEYNSLNELSKNISDGIIHLNKLYEYKEIVKSYQHDTFISKVNQLNYLINDICTHFFTNTEIIVKMKVRKEIKKGSSDQEKPHINFNISINGNKTDSIRTLSGGELDRFSIATTLAFRLLIPNNPFIILDENIASIDNETKSDVISYLQEIKQNKIIICVIHDCAGGIFDNEILLQ